MLARREARQHRQRQLLDHPGGPLVGVTVVSPGPVKSSALIDRVFEAGCQAVRARLADQGWMIAAAEEHRGGTGPELLLAVMAAAGDHSAGQPTSGSGGPPVFPEQVKRALVDLEESHPWGRLWDLDVITADGPLSRAAFGLPGRRCLICGGPAHACARSRAHSVPELLTAIDAIVA